jgi:hypothetical protein
MKEIGVITGIDSMSDPVGPSESETEREKMEKEEKKKGFKRKVVWDDEADGKDGINKKVRWARTREEIEYKRKMRHENIRFMTTHHYHLIEGNNDEMDDPAKYV